jgi:5-bromo-4-chloroindolyl phosphate hydrolysis protein
MARAVLSRSRAANDPLARGRAWLPVVKALALFLLPAPLTLAAVAALVTGDASRFAIVASALACLWTAGVVAWQALVAEAHYWLGARPEPPAVPMKLVSGVMTSVGAALAAIAAGHTLPATVIFALVAMLGHLAFFGRDLRPPRITVANIQGIDVAAVTDQLKQAYSRLRGIDASAQLIAAPEFRDQLSRITAVGRDILVHIERAPADATRARRFLNLYLDSAERVSADYARQQQRSRNAPLDESFRTLLVEMERTFTEQQKRLVEGDITSLDVDIEVLNTRLRSEGLG